MKTYEIQGHLGRSEIHIGESLLNVSKYIDGRRTIIITDTRVMRHYEGCFPNCPVITIDTGEGIKTLATVETIYKQLLHLQADRNTFILGIGGGIVCDIAGFAASTYLRGLDFGFVSTTLLSQVDASVGGKNGVNLDAYKNMVGVFRQPEFVICDTALLKTLDPEEIVNGYAEIVKHALIADSDMFVYMEQNPEKIKALSPDAVTRLVDDSVRIKSGIVQADEEESGERRKLNFGHTVGHAVEKVACTGHGTAVSIGILAAAAFSVEKGFLSKEELERTALLIKKLGMPSAFGFDASRVAEAVKGDKKRENDSVHFVFLTRIGDCCVRKVRFQELADFLNRFSQA
ncbi:MAG: 3-dehydroquinate synthase [Desulfobacteraceae bacterium]